MAVLTNTMMQGTAAISDDAEPYNIEKSIKFNDPDAPSLTRTFSAGNARTWTWAAWVKRNKIGVQHNLFSAYADGNNQGYLVLESDDMIAFDQRISGTWSNATKTTAKIKDTSAWFHITFAFDSTKSVEADRIRLFINGEQITTWNDAPNCAQNLEGKYNSAIEHQIGRGQANSNYLDGYLADVHFIDGLALSPAAFGQFASSGTWNPKAFALPAPNNGTTWSSGVAADSGSDTLTNAANGFDGNISNTIGGLVGGWTWTSPSTLKNVYSLRFYTASFNTTGIIKLNGNIIETAYNFGGAASWYDVPLQDLKSANYEITSLSWNRAPGSGSNNNDYLYAVEVNGVILVDGQTDPTTRNNVNNGTTWSGQVSGSFNGSNNAAKAFDGNLTGSWAIPADNNNVTWTPSPSITAGTSIRLKLEKNGSGGTLTQNGTDLSSSVATGWLTLPSKTLTTLVWGAGASGNQVQLMAVEIDGHILVDSSVDNSFHLKFNDTTSNDSLGRNTFSDADGSNVGAIPIYNTSNEWTLAKGSGYRDDPYKANLVFAMPGDVLTDEHDEIKGSGSAKTVTNDGVAVSTDKSKFYGSSLRIEGTDMLSCASSADFNLHGGDWCVEGWFYSINDTGAQQILIENGTGGVTGWSISRGTNRRLYVYMGSTESMGGNDTTLTPDNEWYHVALVRHGSKTTLYINGNPARTESHDSANGQDGLWIGERSNSSLGFNGYAQDIRIYKGQKKYSGGFIPIRSRDLTVNNLSLTATSLGFAGINHCVVDNYANQNYNNTNGNPSEAWIGTVAEVAAGGFYGVDRIYWIDLGEAKTIEKFVWNLTSDGNSGAGDNAFILFHTDNPASTGSTRCSGGCTVNTANTFSGSMTGSMTVTHDLGSGTTITNRYIGLSNGSGGQPTHWKVTGYTFTDANDGPAAKEPCSSLDTPTNYEDDSGVIRGNYPTLNPLQKASGITLKQGNLSADSNSNHNCVAATMGIRTGKWYWEMTRGSGGNEPAFGIKLSSLPHATIINSVVGNPGFFIRGNEARYWDGTEYVGGLMAGVTQAEGETLGFAFDADAGKIWARKKDGNWANSGDPPNGTGTVGTSFHNDLDEHYWLPCLKTYDGNGHTINFGATAFAHTIPTGFKPICTQNLDDTFSGGEVNNPSKYFDVKTYTGTGASRDIKGVGFGPDLIWVKERGGANDHQVYDQVRGTGKRIRPNTTDAEASQTGGVNAFLSDGWTQGDAGTMNNSGDTYVGWLWDAGTAANGSTNTDGDNITVAVGKQWVNATAGFSITEYAGDGSGAANNDSGDAVGHGLSAKPDFVIIKKKDGVNGWPCWHNVLGDAEHISLNSSNAKESSNHCYTTEPTNTKVDLGNNPEVNGTGNNYIMYCWTTIPGYSSFGVYTGNNSTDGPFVYTGFRPRFILQKRIDAAGNWAMRDTERAPDGQPVYHTLIGETDEAESSNSAWSYDFLSNGFKVRTTQENQNDNNGQFLYCAWAENPFKTARARM